MLDKKIQKKISVEMMKSFFISLKDNKIRCDDCSMAQLCTSEQDCNSILMNCFEKVVDDYQIFDGAVSCEDEHRIPLHQIDVDQIDVDQKFFQKRTIELLEIISQRCDSIIRR